MMPVKFSARGREVHSLAPLGSPFGSPISSALRLAALGLPALFELRRVPVMFR
jgi:hypothetical protein